VAEAHRTADDGGGAGARAAPLSGERTAHGRAHGWAELVRLDDAYTLDSSRGRHGRLAVRRIRVGLAALLILAVAVAMYALTEDPSLAGDVPSRGDWPLF
jgi:hypothetical protein